MNDSPKFVEGLPLPECRPLPEATPLVEKKKKLRSPGVMIRDDHGNLRPAKPGEGVVFRGGSRQVMGEHGELRNRYVKFNKKERRAQKADLKRLALEQDSFKEPISFKEREDYGEQSTTPAN